MVFGDSSIVDYFISFYFSFEFSLGVVSGSGSVFAPIFPPSSQVSEVDGCWALMVITNVCYGIGLLSVWCMGIIRAQLNGVCAAP